MPIGVPDIRPYDQSIVPRPLRETLGERSRAGNRRAAGAIGNELHAGKEPLAAHISHERQIAQLLKLLLKVRRDLPAPRHQIMRHEMIERRDRRGAGDGMMRVGLRVHQPAASPRQRFDHASPREHRTDRRVPATDSLALSS